MARPDQSPEMQRESIQILSLSTRYLLAQKLDTERDDLRNGHLRDWRGLGELIGLSYRDICDIIRKYRVGLRTVALLDIWSTRGRADTLEMLYSYLRDLGRTDILEDVSIQRNIESDVERHRERHRSAETFNVDGTHFIQEPQVTSSTSPSGASSCTRDPMDRSHDNEFLNITVGEVTSGPEYFDAIVCHASGDLALVRSIADRLENHYGVKLCVIERDLVPGPSFFTTIAYLIENRCNKMIIILSPDYPKSPACDFMTKFAQHLSPGARDKRIIPILARKPCDTPAILRHIQRLDFTHPDMNRWSWSHLVLALKPSCLEIPHGVASCFPDASPEGDTEVSREASSDCSLGMGIVAEVALGGATARLTSRESPEGDSLEDAGYVSNGAPPSEGAGAAAMYGMASEEEKPLKVKKRMGKVKSMFKIK